MMLFDPWRVNRWNAAGTATFSLWRLGQVSNDIFIWEIMACIALVALLNCFSASVLHLCSSLASLLVPWYFLLVGKLCFERLIIAGLSDGLAVVLCLSLSFSVIFYSFALSYQSSSSNAEEIVKERERTQELAQIQAVHHPTVLLASNLLNDVKCTMRLSK